MKKLMIAAAIVCVAVVSQAATYNWNFMSDSVVYDGYNAAAVGQKSSNNAGAGLSAYLIAYNATTMNQDTILAGLRDGKTVAEIAGGSLIATSATGSDSMIASSKWSDEVGATLNAFQVILTTDGKSAFFSADDSFAASAAPGETSVYWSTTKTKTLQDNDGTFKFADNGAGWYSAAAVPEPTSGLLLLLGVAGLALRRRRA